MTVPDPAIPDQTASDREVANPPGTIPTLAQALAVSRQGEELSAHVHDGFDVFGIPHGGYLAALGAAAVLEHTRQPDIFTITTHFLRKAVVGPMTFLATPVGGSRRFTTVTATASQNGHVVMSIMASVGDRTMIQGPAWTTAPPTALAEQNLSPPATTPGPDFQPPNIAARLGLRLDTNTMGFTHGQIGDHATVRAVTTSTEPSTQLVAIIACDATVPAVFNALGPKGWVPTVELTVHLRARPDPGPLMIDVVTNHVTDGFLDEDATVFDATGRLVAQSRQLARWAA
ncbi:MAG: thioesterase family protein [Euzebya sp.]